MSGRVAVSRTLISFKCVLLCTVWTVTPVFAQSTQRSTTLEPILVTPSAPARRANVRGQHQRQTNARVTARRARPAAPVESRAGSLSPAERSVLAAPSNISVIGARQIDQTGMHGQRDLAQALPNVTGFDAGGNRMTNFTIRGMREFGCQSALNFGSDSLLMQFEGCLAL